MGIWHLCRRYESMGLEAIHDPERAQGVAPRSGRPREFTALQRVGIEQLACCEPAGIGLEMTHWFTRRLAKVAMQRGFGISYCAIDRIADPEACGFATSP